MNARAAAWTEKGNGCLWRSTIGPIHPDDPDWTETPWT